MKTLMILLCGLAMFSATVGAALWMHAWTIVRQNTHVCVMLKEEQQKHEADVAFGTTPMLCDYSDLIVLFLESERGTRCADLTLYGRTLLGLSFFLSLVLLVVRPRSQDLVTDPEDPVHDHIDVTDVLEQLPSSDRVGWQNSPGSVS
jgi:hypothetical protein